ncbi:relaxase/mobilization nuclease domain-containing protein [Listeria booriae]|uniref:relaxase/mobilization nuclease domain-containing protein n=1 Tax=Listeria booriae TaxID=1552123 RepID=UPI00162524B4|nr:relaxase/mobilization nuclease domain-containing protein [Listeria booriae]MBC1890077.1 relaxase/mobilization nuclease domain-containing protein [Listeria booriae]
MAVTKIHAIKNSVPAAIKYIMNPEKTDGQLLVSGYNCDPIFGATEFAMTQELAREVKGDYRKTGGNEIKAFHLIQSFAPDDDLTFEQAHDIGKKLASEVVQSEHEYVIATHIDKGHIHNHIIFNSVSFFTHKKFRSQPYKTAAKIRAINDRLCTENKLQVLDFKRELKNSYKKYQKYKKNTSYRSEIRKRLNYVLETEMDYASFLEKSALLGVSLKETEKHITYMMREQGQERGTRDTKLSDNDTYTKNGIEERLNKNKDTIPYLEDAIKKSFEQATTWEDFDSYLKENFQVTYRKNREGLVTYMMDDVDGTKVKERALKIAYHQENLETVIGESYDFVMDESEQDYREVYENQVHTVIEEIDTEIVLDDQTIDEITPDGILINIQDGALEGKIFLDSRQIDFDQETNKYTAHIGDKFSYYFNEKGIENQQGKEFLRGEQLIRSIEKAQGVQGKELQLYDNMVKSISEKGTTLSFPDKGIDSLFIPSEYMRVTQLDKKLHVSVYENWNYYYREPLAPDAAPDKKAPLLHIKGSDLIQLIETQTPSFELSLANKVNMMHGRQTLQGTKKLADMLLTIREEDIQGMKDVEMKIHALLGSVQGAREEIKKLETAIVEYNQVAKYLVAYNKYLPTKLEVDQSKLKKAKLQHKFKGELASFHHAEKELEKRGIHTNVDVDKVVQLVKSNQQTLQEIKHTMEEQNERLTYYRDMKQTIERINYQQIPHENQQENNRKNEVDR